MNSLNKDVTQIIFDCLPVSDKYNFYLYCKEKNLEELEYVEKYFQSLYNISRTDWYSIIIENENQLHYDFINKYKDVIDWRMLSIYQTFTPDFFEKFSTYIDWESASSQQKFTIDTLEKFKYYINWDLMSAREDITEEILDAFTEEIKWIHVKLEDFSDNFLNRHKDVIHWSNVSFSNIDRYEDYKDNIDWVRLSYHEKLTENFMRRHQERLDWNFLSSHQEMSDEFVQEFSDKINMETRNFFNNRRNRREGLIIRGIPPIPPPLIRQSRLRNYRPAFFEY